MKIYALTFGSYDDEHVVGHYSSLELAFEAMKRLNVTAETDAAVNEFEMDGDYQAGRFIPYSEYLAWRGPIPDPQTVERPADMGSEDGVEFGGPNAFYVLGSYSRKRTLEGANDGIVIYGRQVSEEELLEFNRRRHRDSL